MEDMKMVDQSKVEKALETAWPLMSPNGVNGMQGQMQVLLDGQAELLQETQKIATAWTKRHQEAMEAGLQTFQTMCSSKAFGTENRAATATLAYSCVCFSLHTAAFFDPPLMHRRGLRDARKAHDQ